MRTLLLLIVLALLASPALADDNKKKAMAAFAAAKEAHRSGNYRLSLRKLREAYALFPNPGIRISIARRLIDLDEPKEALAELQQIKSRKHRKLVAAEIGKVQDMLAQPVPLAIESSPPGATVIVAGKSPRKTPFRVSLPRGPVEVTVRLSGHESISTTITLKGTKRIRRNFVLKAIRAKLRVLLSNGPLNQAPPSAWIEVDGKRITPGKGFSIEPGRHDIACGYAGAAGPTRLRVKVPAGKAATIRCTLPAAAEQPINWRTPTGWTSIAGGAAAIAAGIALFVSHAADEDTYQEPTYTINGSSKQIGGGIATGIGAGLVGLGTYFLLSK